MILGGDLHTDLQVLADVSRQHGPQTLQRVFHRQGAKEIHQPLQRQTEKQVYGHIFVRTSIVIVFDGLRRTSGLRRCVCTTARLISYRSV